MPPEQLRDSKRVDARCDIYALGAVLFECLAGRPPFEAETTVALAAKVLLEETPDVRTYRPTAPAALATLILRCMQRRPHDRFPSASALLQAFTAL